ncbi:MAG: 23S rRNA (uracil(1939)-C(5))-methyltransferase RlmD [Deltaproteobacteria bacterium]|nr:23S rRNA (uracil(1939)-C(5))-methyltransferase RlmD [Deltaproteobacteria bacterium]
MDVELTIDSLAFGRAAVGRVEGRVVFVEGAAPGERVRARVRRDHGSYAEADLIEVLEPGSVRVAPPCPIVDECGGCPWQHVDYQAQLAAKRRAIVDALERIGGIADPEVGEVTPSPQTLGYRNRLSLRFERGRMGFYQARSNTLVPVPDCLLAEPRIREALPQAERFAGGLKTDINRVEIATRGLLPGLVLALQSKGRLRHADTLATREMVETPDTPVRGVVLSGRGWRRQWGEIGRRFEVAEGVCVELPGASFGQVNTAANRILVATVVDAVLQGRAPRVLELFAGAGNFSFALARSAARVIAVDEDAAAVEAGRRAVEDSRVPGLRFVASAAKTYLERHAERPDVLVVDPPRSGLGDAVTAAGALRPARIVYVSCNPPTLARDLRALGDHGYRLVRADPIDLFPHTFHVETVCTLELT